MKKKKKIKKIQKLNRIWNKNKTLVIIRNKHSTNKYILIQMALKLIKEI